MALLTPYPSMPETKVFYGIGQMSDVILIQPGVSDYVTGGYILSAINARLTHFTGAIVVGANAAANAYDPVILFPATSFGVGLAPTPSLTIAFQLLVATTGVEVANAFNLTGTNWLLQVYGY
jgi:hypothetical protein